MAFVRIATEEAFATAELFDCYRRIIEGKTVDDPGFYSLWGHYLTDRGVRASDIRRRLLDLGEERLRESSSVIWARHCPSGCSGSTSCTTPW